jgi:NAD(P)-dependent dehydrogenase (short-subunit alcohol dehydrogenase family)
MATPQRILITGVSSGLGFALVKALLARGAQVAGVARRPEGLSKLTALAPERFLAIEADVSRPAELAKAVSAAASRWNGLDAVVANAGIGIPATVDTMRMEDVRRVFDTNVCAAIETLLLALPHVRKSDAPLLAATTSLAGWRAGPGAAPYCASKAALSAFLDSLRAELHHEGIRVLDIAPGFVKSEMTARNAFAMPFLMETDAAAQKMASAILRRKSHVSFPWPMTSLAWLVRRLPDGVYDVLARRIAARLRRAGSLGVLKQD